MPPVSSLGGVRLNLHHPHNPDAESPDVWENLIPPPLGIGDITTGKSPLLLRTARGAVDEGSGMEKEKKRIKEEETKVKTEKD
ncbi:hypothetical protein E2C01_091150 [Portunus trituberculatus]|uniref:Uncharacterized protein n=1 Tax=Portunus trituberculatus TaxID=210409 RepID=A0A5B7JD88_PORTR|nr:hypothetical protein [Portunus trituberculatus]